MTGKPENNKDATALARLPTNLAKLAGAVAIFIAGVAIYLFATSNTELADKLSAEGLQDWITKLGPGGPLAIVGLMVAAILISPFPSAPIALAAGAAYGPVWGTAYVAIGSELGAIAAFLTSRFLGRDLVLRWIGAELTKGLAGSQSALMGSVFFSRLLPFISFDLISYAAGLSTLTFWRFALATLVGIIPASFLLAHFGKELASGEVNRMVWTSLLLAAVVLVPLLTKAVRMSKRRG